MNNYEKSNVFFNKETFLTNSVKLNPGYTSAAEVLYMKSHVDINDDLIGLQHNYENRHTYLDLKMGT